MWQSSQAMWQHPVSRFGSSYSTESASSVEDKRAHWETISSPLRTSALTSRLRNDGRNDSLLNEVQPSPLKQFSRLELEGVVEESVSRCISQLGLVDMHERVLHAVRKLNTERPDFSPIVLAINEIAQHATHGSESQTAMLEALSQVRVDMPAPDLGAMEKILEEIRNEVHRTGDDIRREVAGCCENLRQEFAAMRNETAEIQKESRIDSEAIPGEVRNLPQEVLQRLDSLPGKNDIAAAVHEQILKIDYSQLLDAIERVDSRLNLTPLMDAIQSTELDFTPILNAINVKLDGFDSEHLASGIHSRICNHIFQVDQSEVLQAVSQSRGEIDARALAEAVHGNFSDSRMKVDNTDVLQALRRLEPDYEALSGVLLERMKSTFGNTNHGLSSAQTKFEFEDRSIKPLADMDASELSLAIERIDRRLDFTPIVEAISSIELDLTPIHEAISKIKVTVDPSPVLHEIQRSEMLDYGRIATAVVDRLGGHMFKVDQSEFLQGVRDSLVTINSSMGQSNSVVLDAISQLRNDVSVLRQTIDSVKNDHQSILDTVSRLPCPDSATIEDGVRGVSRSAPVIIDSTEILEAIGEVLHAIKGISIDVDLHPLLEAVSKEVLQATRGLKVETDLTPVLEAIDNREILQAIKSIKVEPDLRPLLEALLSDILKALKGMKMEVNLQPVLEAVNNAAIDLNPLHEAICKRELELVPLWEAVGKMKLPDADMFASSVTEKLRSTEGLLIPDTQVLAHAIAEKLQRNCICMDNKDVLEAIQTLATDLDNSAVLKDVLTALKSTHADLGAAISRVCSVMDPTPVLEAIREVNTLDCQVFAEALYERLSGRGLHEWQSRVIEEIRSIRIPPADLTPLIRAINDAEVDLSPATDAVNKVSLSVNLMRNEMKQLLKGAKHGELEASSCHDSCDKQPNALPVMQVLSVTHPPVLTDPVRTLPFSVEVVQKSMQAAVGRTHSPLPNSRGATVAVPSTTPTVGGTPRTPTPRLTNRLQVAPHQAQQRPVELIQGGDMPLQGPSRSVSRQRSLEVLPGRSVEAQIDFPAPRLLEQHQTQSGVLSVTHARAPSPLKSLSTCCSAPVASPLFGQLLPTRITETTQTVTEVVNEVASEAPQASPILTLSPLNGTRSSSTQRTHSAGRHPRRSDGRSSDVHTASETRFSESLRTFSFQD